MFKARYIDMAAVLLAAFIITMSASDARTAETGDKISAKEKEQKSIAVLKSDSPAQDKAIACKRLAVYGSKDAVPALSALLTNEQLASWARIALEAIPDPSAEDALRDSLDKLQGRLLVGAINSIGVRRDAKSTDKLAARLKDSDAEVASAAAVALGRIGTPQAAKALEQSLAGALPAVRTAIAEGCILCAEKYLTDKKSNEAVKLYEYVRKADVPKQKILEATRGSILARGTAGAPLLIEQLKSADKAFFAIGLQTARELPGDDVTDALVAELNRMPPERQSLMILVLADRGGTKVLPAMLQAAKNGSGQIRLKAIGVLERMGDRSCVPVLLDAAQEANEELAQTAVRAIANLPDKSVDGDLAERLPKAEGKTRRVLIQLAGLRRIVAANPTLLKAVNDTDNQIRFAALTALGDVIQVGDLPVLIARVANPQTPEETQVALKALNVACTRMPDRETCAEKIIAALSQSPVPARCNLLKVLGATGGTKALEAVAAAAKDANPEIKDLGGQLLGGWSTADAAPVLLDLAKTSAEEKYKIRAMRGYLRIARQFAMPNEQRVELCRNALQTATRDEEKKMVLEVLSRYPSIDMLKIAVEAGKNQSLKNDAARHALLIAQKLGDSDEVRKLLAEAGLEPVKVEIIKAEYGAGNNLKDVTEILRQRIGKYSLIVLRKPSYSTSFGGDPAPGITKQLKIKYKINDKPGETSFPDNAPIMLPIPE